MAAVFDEATTFFGIRARHGSRLNANRHVGSFEAASIGTERFDAKLRVAEALMVRPLLCGVRPTIADCVAMALVEFADQFYGVSLPSDCQRLSAWYDLFAKRQRASRPDYPVAMLDLAQGLPDQNGSRATTSKSNATASPAEIAARGASE